MRIRATNRMRAVTVTMMLALAAPSPLAFASADGAAAGTVAGIAVDTANHPLGHYGVRLRSVDNGGTRAFTTTDAAGQFIFSGITVGQYILELVDQDGHVVALSPIVVVSAAVPAASGIVLMARSARRPTGAAAGNGFFRSTAGMVLAAAAAAGLTAGVLVSRSDASPSK